MGEGAVIGRKPLLTAEQRAEIQRLAALRRELAAKRLAERYGVSLYVIRQAENGVELRHHISVQMSQKNETQSEQ